MGLYETFGREAETVLGYVDNGTTDNAAAPLEVPASVYLDADRHTLEMDRIFRRLPLLAGLTAEIANPGDYKALQILDKPILITRGRDGELSAMINACTHRGMPVAATGSGSAKRFSCPYHGWTFAADGALLGVSDPQKFGPVCKEERGLARLPVAEAGGLIFVGLTNEVTVDVRAHLGGLLDDFEALGFDKWHYCGERTIYGANWKIAYDGYLEGYHFAAAHPTTIHPRTHNNIMHFTAFGPHMRITFPQVDIKTTLANTPRETWGQCENKGFDFVRTIFPHSSIFVASEITQIAQLLPGPGPGQNTTKLMYLRREPPRDAEDAAAIQTMINFLAEVVDREDYGVGLEVQRGLMSGSPRTVLFGRNERGNQFFHKTVDYYLSDDPGKTPPVL